MTNDEQGMLLAFTAALLRRTGGVASITFDECNEAAGFQIDVTRKQRERTYVVSVVPPKDEPAQ